jgi:hypothetical protein
MTAQRKNVFQLAENLGMPVAVLMRDMPLSEFCEWMQFYSERAEDAEREEKKKPKLPPKGADLVMRGFGI